MLRRVYTLFHGKMLRILSGDLLDRKLGRADDCFDPWVVAVGLRPTQRHLAVGLLRFERDADVFDQPQASCLENRRNGRTDQRIFVRTAELELDMTPRKNSGQPVTAVPVKRDVDHGPPTG